MLVPNHLVAYNQPSFYLFVFRSCLELDVHQRTSEVHLGLVCMSRTRPHELRQIPSRNLVADELRAIMSFFFHVPGIAMQRKHAVDLSAVTVH